MHEPSIHVCEQHQWYPLLFHCICSSLYRRSPCILVWPILPVTILLGDCLQFLDLFLWKVGVILLINQFTYDYVKLYIGYFCIRIPVWERFFTLFHFWKFIFGNSLLETFFPKLTFQNSLFKTYFLKLTFLFRFLKLTL